MTTIERVDNGYLVQTGASRTVFLSLDEVFGYLLQYYEGRQPSFLGSAFGKVVVMREEHPTPPLEDCR